MSYQQASMVTFAAVAGAGGVALAAWAGPRASVRFLSGFGLYCAALAVLYVGLAAGLPAATKASPHAGLWAPDIVAALPPTLGTVTVGSLAVWVALVTAERTRLATFDWSEAEIFGAVRTALAGLDSALQPFHEFLLAGAAAEGWAMLCSQWDVRLGGPVIGPGDFSSSQALEAAFTAERREVLSRALGSAESAASQLATAGIRIGRPLQPEDHRLRAWTSLDGDVTLLRGLLAWLNSVDAGVPDARSRRARLVFLLARCAAARRQLAGSANDDQPGLRLWPSWLAELLGQLEIQRRGLLPPAIPDTDVPDLALVSDGWDEMVRSRLGRQHLRVRLDAADPARSPSRPFAAPTHGQLWDGVITAWHADMGTLAAAEPAPPERPAPSAGSYAAVLPDSGAIFTITVPAPADSPLAREMRAAGRQVADLILGKLEAGKLWGSSYPQEVRPEDIWLWAVTSDARWHQLPLAAWYLSAQEVNVPDSLPGLSASTRPATGDASAQTLWACQPPLSGIRWWVASWRSSEPSKQRELRPVTETEAEAPDSPGAD